MRVRFILAAALALASAASAEEAGRPTALLVSPIHEARVVRGDDGMDHVEYELLVVSVFAEPVTLSSVAVLDPAGRELMRIDGDADHHRALGVRMERIAAPFPGRAQARPAPACPPAGARDVSTR